MKKLIFLLFVLIIGCTPQESIIKQNITTELKFNMTDIGEAYSFRFFTNCTYDNITMIKIYLNGQDMYYDKPYCFTINELAHDYFPKYLIVGENKITIEQYDNSIIISDLQFTEHI